MNDLDRIAALATIAARCEMLGEKLAACRIPATLLAELAVIQRAVEGVLESYDPKGGEPKG